MVLVAGAGTVLLCFIAVAILGRLSRAPTAVPATLDAHAESVLSGDPQ